MDAREARQIASAAIEAKYASYFTKIEEAAKEGLREVTFRGERIPSDLADELTEREFSVSYKSYTEENLVSWH